MELLRICILFALIYMAMVNRDFDENEKLKKKKICLYLFILKYIFKNENLQY